MSELIKATVGKVNTPKPSMVDFVNRAKWNAWSEVSNLSQSDAEKEYINIVNDLAGKEAPVEAPSSDADRPKFECIIASVECGNIYKIVLNRPAKLNALTVQMVIYQIVILKLEIEFKS